jgi:hypothetical protein
MTAPAYSQPVRLDLGGAYFDLGTEDYYGIAVVRLCIDNGNHALDVPLSPEEARQLAAELTRLADTP